MDGTPRDCILNACGAQADTGLIRDAEIDRGQFGPLGWTQGGGNCKPDAAIGQYIGLGTAPKYTGGRTFTSPDKKEDDLDAQASAGSPKCRAAYDHHADLLFGKREPSANPVGDAIGIGLSLPQIGFLGLGGNRTLYPEETIVGDYTGYGKDNGLPTTDDDNTISVVYRQVYYPHQDPINDTRKADLILSADQPGWARSEVRSRRVYFCWHRP